MVEKKKRSQVVDITLIRQKKNYPLLEITAKPECEDREKVARTNKR